MATRFYLPTSGSPPVSPTFSSDWDSLVTPAGRLPSSTSKANTTLAVVTRAFSTTTNNNGRLLVFQYVSTSTINALNFAGCNFNLSVQCLADSPLTAFLRANARLYHSDTSFDTLVATADFDTAFATTRSSRIISTPCANIQAQSGDRIVVEIGFDVSGVTSASKFVRCYLGDPTANSDLPLSSGNTSTTLDPWFEFNPSPILSKSVSGSVSFAGALLLKPSHLYFTAALNFAGSLGGRFSHIFLSTATLSFVGSISKSLRRTLTASFISSGVVRKFVSVKRTATLSFSGGFTPVHTFNKIFAATLSFSGSVGRFIFKRIQATLSFIPNMILSKGGSGILYLQSFVANLSFAPAIARFIQSGQSSALNLSGTTNQATSSHQSGQLSFSGQITKATNVLRAAFGSVLSFVGSTTKLKGKLFVATLNFSTSMRKQISSIQSATLNFTGNVFKFISTQIFTAVLSFIGVRVDSLQLLVQGATVMRITCQGGTLMQVTTKEK